MATFFNNISLLLPLILIVSLLMSFNVNQAARVLSSTDSSMALASSVEASKEETTTNAFLPSLLFSHPRPLPVPVPVPVPVYVPKIPMPKLPSVPIGIPLPTHPPPPPSSYRPSDAIISN
ncbi:hypothetical protein M9H77_19626 [Catharanthus roseus]|uniref:Uncharacterized protein n=1 Tax=Catharanthus roseus TaxID=4058 RepID=A0ACC0BB48_CATRO|nr:hypothetical protein M9H77_19626 [Catharanthus roseus]